MTSKTVLLNIPGVQTTELFDHASGSTSTFSDVTQRSSFRISRTGDNAPQFGTVQRVKVRTVKTPPRQKNHPPKNSISAGPPSDVLLDQHGHPYRINDKGFSVVERKRKPTSHERLQIAATNLLPNALNYQLRDFQFADGSYRATDPNGSYVQYQGQLSSVGGGFTDTDMAEWEPTGDEREAARNRCISKILEKLKDQKVNLAQVFAERIKTADMIALNATRIANAFLSLKKGNIKGACDVLDIGLPTRKLREFNKRYAKYQSRAAAQAFLEIQYGWRPLLQDIYGAAEFLAAKQSHEVRNVVRSRIKIDSNRDDQQKVGLEWTAHADVVTFRERRYEVSMSVWFSTSNGLLATAGEAGLLNPLYLAWELLPYSFVVDWFLPVGKYLNSLDATLGLEFEKGSFTEYWEAKQKRLTVASSRDAVSGRVYDINIKGTCRQVCCFRTPLLRFPRPVAPAFKNPLSFEHAANAIALLTTAFSSKR